MKRLALLLAALAALGCAAPCPARLEVSAERDGGEYEGWAVGAAVEFDLGIHPGECPAYSGRREEG